MELVDGRNRLTPEELAELRTEMQGLKRQEFAKGWFNRDGDQPVKVVPMDSERITVVSGYFCQLKALLGKTPEEIEGILGIYEKLTNGACIIRIDNLLLPGFYEDKAYTYLPGGKKYRPSGDESKNPYRPAKQPTAQWQLTREVGGTVLAKLKPGERFRLNEIDYGRSQPASP